MAINDLIQIHELGDIPLTGSEYLAVDNGTLTGKASIVNIMGSGDKAISILSKHNDYEVSTQSSRQEIATLQHTTKTGHFLVVGILVYRTTNMTARAYINVGSQQLDDDMTNSTSDHTGVLLGEYNTASGTIHTISMLIGAQLGATAIMKAYSTYRIMAIDL